MSHLATSDADEASVYLGAELNSTTAKNLPCCLFVWINGLWGF